MKVFGLMLGALLATCVLVNESPAQRIVARRNSTVQINNGVPVGGAVAGPTFSANFHAIHGSAAISGRAFVGGYQHNVGAVFDPGFNFGYNHGRSQNFRNFAFDAGYGARYSAQSAFLIPGYYAPQASFAAYTQGQCSGGVGGGGTTYAPPAMAPVTDETTTTTTPYRRTTVTTFEEGGQSTVTRSYSSR